MFRGLGHEGGHVARDFRAAVIDHAAAGGLDGAVFDVVGHEGHKVRLALAGAGVGYIDDYGVLRPTCRRPTPCAQ
jgi:hypothetical protein